MILAFKSICIIEIGLFIFKNWTKLVLKVIEIVNKNTSKIFVFYN
jgi:hypothetical protein